MNTKRFTVVDTRIGGTKTFDSTANTVGELKAELRREGIDPDGMAIQEGLTKTELGDNDAAYLPHDVPYRGTITNNLVFRLTQKEKKIKSGAMSRSEAYTQVKALGLTDKIAKKYGKNFTMCKTDDLIVEITAALKKDARSRKAENCAVTKALVKLTGILVDKGILLWEEGTEIANGLGIELTPSMGYSAVEIDKMFADM